MTDLVERYLTAVERRLPKATARDIVAELREVLSSKIEAREAELGRTATADEIAAVLKAYGHPVVVAAGYAGHDYVIGPGYYPWFWHVQRLAVGLAVAIGFGVVAVRALGSEEPFTAAMRGFGGAIQAALVTFAVVTALFIAAERNKLDMKWADRWDPKALPRDHIREPKGLFESGLTIVFDIIFLLWWVKVVQFPNEIPVQGDGAAGMHFSAGWNAVYWPVLVLSVGATAVHILDLVRPAWTPLRSVVRIAGHVAGLGVLWVLFRSQPLVEVVALNGAQQVEVDRISRLFDGIVNVSLAVTAVIWAATIGVEVWRLWRSMRPRNLAAA